MKILTATYKGLIVSCIMIILSVIFFYILKYPPAGYNQLGILSIFVIGLLWTLIAFKIRNEGIKKTFKDYFSEGFRFFIVVTLFMVIYTFIFQKLNPQILENAIKESNAMLVKQGNYMAPEIEANANKLRGIFMPMMMSITTVKFLFLGAVITALAAIFLNQPDVSKQVI